MALFKIYRGDRTNLPTTLHDGYAYFCADTGEFFIDVALMADKSDLVRKQINALSAIKLANDDKTIEIDDIVLKDDIIDVEHGGTGVNTLTAGGLLKGNGTGAVETINGKGILYAATAGAPDFVEILPLTAGGTGGNSADSARENLEVYSKDEIDKNTTTTAYTHTLTIASWQADSAGGYVSTYQNNQLKCGKAGNVPPEITFTSNREEYNKIESAMAESGVGIKFYIEKIPSNDIGIIIIDQL